MQTVTSNRKGSVLVVDDEPNSIQVLSAILSAEGYDVLTSRDVDGATRIIHKKNVDTVITDLMMPNTDGMQFFRYMHEHYPNIPVIFMTAYGTVESAVTAMNQGAYYYFIKPPDYPKLKHVLAQSIEHSRVSRDAGNGIAGPEAGGQCGMIGRTREMLKIGSMIDSIKNSSSNLLLVGETGTGKEVLARMAHFNSARKDKPFVAFNCASIPKELVESELFGYEKGAFTGAAGRRIGKFEEADGGTILLDEVGELDHALQAKLLRVLQEREIERLGSNKKIKVDFRLISSTNRDLRKEVQNGNFREDLFYRVNVIEIKLPPLRERRDDIPPLVEEFVREFCLREGKTLSISQEVMEAFMLYHWPGNIRQLKNVIERAVVLTQGSTVSLVDLNEEFFPSAMQKPVAACSGEKTLKEIEFHAIQEALRTCNGNKSKAARLLGISRKALYKRLGETEYGFSGTA